MKDLFQPPLTDNVLAAMDDVKNYISNTNVITVSNTITVVDKFAELEKRIQALENHPLLKTSDLINPRD